MREMLTAVSPEDAMGSLAEGDMAMSGTPSDKPRFSFVIPVYNVAPYLRECLDSILAQSITDWEAICVDDGSTDGSADVLDEYGKRDSRFKIIHQTNAGVSAARNRGLDAVRGEYFFFVDPDDLIEKDYIKNLYQLVCEKPGCVGAVGAVFFSDSDATKNEKLVLTSGEFSAKEKVGIRIHTGPLWNKIYPRCLLEGNSIRFLDGLRLNEDTVFLIRIGSRVKSYVVNSGYLGYRYRVRSDSLCHKVSILEMTNCCWDDVVALSKTDEGKADRYMVREFMYFCVLPHVMAFSRVDDTISYLKYAKSQLELWRLLITYRHRAEDKIYHPEYEVFSKVYSRIITLHIPVAVMARLLCVARIGCKVANRFKRMCLRYK